MNKNLLVLFLGVVMVSACAHTQTTTVAAPAPIDPLAVNVAEDGYALTLPGSLWKSKRETDPGVATKKIQVLNNSFTKGQIVIGVDPVGESFVELAKKMHAEIKAASGTKKLSKLQFVSTTTSELASYSFVTSNTDDTMRFRNEVYLVRLGSKMDKVFLVTGSWPLRFDGVMSIDLHKILHSIR